MQCNPLFTSRTSRQTYILPGFAPSLLQPPREQCHNNKLCWSWADNVLCLRTARRFTMKGCQCVREHAFSLSVSLCLSEGPLETWWGRRGGVWRGGSTGSWDGAPLLASSGGKRSTSGVIFAVVVHSSNCFTQQRWSVITSAACFWLIIGSFIWKCPS